MGAAASVAAKKLDKSQVMAIFGDKFDEAQFEQYKDGDGCIDTQLLILAAQTIPGIKINLETAQMLVGTESMHEEIFGVLKDAAGNITVDQLLAAAKGQLLLNSGSAKPVTGPVSDAEAKEILMNDGLFLEHCSEEQRNNMSLAVPAVTNTGSALKFCSPALQDNLVLVKMALRSDGTNISFASPRLQADAHMVELALKGLPSYSMKWEAVQLAAKIYARDHQALKDAPLSLRGDNDVIKVVVEYDGLGLKHAMPMVRHERDVVVIALKQNMQAVFYASPVALVSKEHPDYKVAPLDPEIITLLDALWAEQKPAESKEPKWCPDSDAVEKGIARFPELAKYSPPAEWLASCAERATREKAAAETRRISILKAREDEEKKDAVWTAGLPSKPAEESAAPAPAVEGAAEAPAAETKEESKEEGAESKDV